MCGTLDEGNLLITLSKFWTFCRLLLFKFLSSIGQLIVDISVDVRWYLSIEISSGRRLIFIDSSSVVVSTEGKLLKSLEVTLNRVFIGIFVIFKDLKKEVSVVNIHGVLGNPS